MSCNNYSQTGSDWVAQTDMTLAGSGATGAGEASLFSVHISSPFAVHGPQPAHDHKMHPMRGGWGAKTLPSSGTLESKELINLILGRRTSK